MNLKVRYLILAALLLTACRASGPAASTAPATPSAAVPTIDPATQTASPQPAPSDTPARTVTPTQTSAARATPTVAPACFVSDFYPLSFMPDGTRMVFWAAAGVQVFNLQTLQFEMVLGSPLTLTAVVLSPDGNTLAWALADNTMQLIRISDKKLLHTLIGHTDVIGKLRFSPHGDRLYSASHDSWVRIWDLDGNLVGAFQPTGGASSNGVLGIGISPDGSMIATIPFDGPVKLWDLSDYHLVRQLGAYGGYETSDAAFSPDGQLIVAETANGLFLWKTSDGTELLGGNPGINTMAAAFSPDGRLLAYAEIGETYDVVLTSPDGSKRIRTLTGDPGPVWELFFSPDSALLVSGGVETRVWRVADGQLMATGKQACP